MATDASDSFEIYSRDKPPRPLPSDPTLRADIEHVLEHGYVILPNCFSKAEAREAREEIVRLLQKDGPALGCVFVSLPYTLTNRIDSSCCIERR
jgi:hypothetical protein